MTYEIDPELRETLKNELLLAWKCFRERYPQDDFYAFGICTTDVASYFGVVACSEQGLLKGAEACEKRDEGSFELQLASLRWSIGDSPFSEDGFSMLPQTHALRADEPNPYSHPDEDLVDRSIGRFFSSAFAALHDLDEIGTFGLGAERDRIVLSVWLHDESNSEMVESAEKLNSPACVARYAAELESGIAAFLANYERSRARNSNA